jgi:hypothetical protein
MQLKNGLTLLSVAVVLAGCGAHSHQLTKDSSPQLLKGEFTHGQTNRLSLETADGLYEATGFTVQKHTNWAELQRRYRGSDPKHWDRIFSGHDIDHETYSAEVNAVAKNGAELTCRLAWPSGKIPQGLCLDKAGKEFAVRFD